MGGVLEGEQRDPGTSTRFMRSAQGVAGVALVAVGVALLAVVGAYYGYATFARAQLDNLNYSIETTAPQASSCPSARRRWKTIASGTRRVRWPAGTC